MINMLFTYLSNLYFIPDHVDLKIYFINDIISQHLIYSSKESTKNNLSYMHTKPIIAAKFKHCLSLVTIFHL